MAGPDTNFDFLNDLSRNAQVEIVKEQETFEKQSDNLSELLSNVNVRLKESKKKKRDSQIFFTAEANRLAEKSENITQEVLKARADPFHGLKVLIGASPSIRELAVKHNAVQNEMNRVQRRFTSGLSEFNHEVSAIQDQLSLASTQRKLTQENIAQAGATAQVFRGQVLAQDAIIKQQLDTMLLPDLQEALADPNSKLPKGLVKKRILEMQGLEAELKRARASKGKTELELFSQFGDIAKKHADLIPESLVAEALATNKTVTFMGMPITPQTAKILQPLQAKARDERQTLIGELASKSFEAQVGKQNISGAIQRAVGPGVSVIATDANGNATGFNFEAVSPEVQKSIAKIQELNQAIDFETSMLSEVDDTEIGESLATSKAAKEALIVDEINNLMDQLVKEGQQGVEDDQAKEAIEQYIRTGRINAPAGANSVLMESNAVAVPGSNSSAVHGIGWGTALNLYAQLYQNNLSEMVPSTPEFQGEDGEIDSDQLLKLALKGSVRKDAEIASMNAVNTKTENQFATDVQTAALADWSEIAVVHAIQQLIESHADETATVDLLTGLIRGDLALGEQFTQGDGMATLFATIAVKEAQLKEAGGLPENSNLAGELQSLLLSEQFYAQPSIRQLTQPQTQDAASLAQLAFRNQQHQIFQATLTQNVLSIPLNNVQKALAAAKAQVDAQNPITVSRTRGENITLVNMERRKQARETAADLGDEPSLQTTIMNLLQNQ